MLKDKKTFYALRCALISRVIRALTDFNQKDFAEKLDVTRTTVTSMESLAKVPRAYVLIDLMQIGANHGIDFEFTEEGMGIFITNEGALALLEKIDLPKVKPKAKKVVDKP